MKDRHNAFSLQALDRRSAAIIPRFIEVLVSAAFVIGLVSVPG